MEIVEAVMARLALATIVVDAMVDVIAGGSAMSSVGVVRVRRVRRGMSRGRLIRLKLCCRR